MAKENEHINQEPEKSIPSEEKPISPNRLSYEESIGGILKKTREQQGISLEKASELTKLRPRYLRALEEDDFEVLPNKIVARGFLKIYADRLGLDVSAITHIFDEKFQGKVSTASNLNVSKEKPVSVSRSITKKTLVPSALSSSPIKNSSSHQTFLTFITKQYRHYFYYGIAIIAVLLLFMHLTSMFLKDMNRTPQKRVARQEVTPIDKTPELLRNQQKGFEGVIVIARPLDSTWMRVYIDGIVDFKGPVNKGMVKQFQARNYVRIRAGNGRVIDLLVNKKHYGKMSQEEKLVDKRFYPLSTEEAASENETEYKDSSVLNPDVFGWEEGSSANIEPPEGEEPWQEQMKKAAKAKEQEEPKKEENKNQDGWW